MFRLFDVIEVLMHLLEGGQEGHDAPDLGNCTTQKHKNLYKHLHYKNRYKNLTYLWNESFKTKAETLRERTSRPSLSNDFDHDLAIEKH